MNNSTNQCNIIKVAFHIPKNGRIDYYFGSIKAIYSVFSPAEVGCAIQSLYAAKLSRGGIKVTDRCVISKQEVVRSKSTR